MLKCTDIAAHASAYVDGELSFWQRFKVRSHLRACIHCARLIRHLRLTLGYTRRLDREQASLEEAEAVLQRVLAAQTRNS